MGIGVDQSHYRGKKPHHHTQAVLAPGQPASTESMEMRRKRDKWGETISRHCCGLKGLLSHGSSGAQGALASGSHSTVQAHWDFVSKNLGGQEVPKPVRRETFSIRFSSIRDNRGKTHPLKRDLSVHFVHNIAPFSSVSVHDTCAFSPQTLTCLSLTACCTFTL